MDIQYLEDIELLGFHITTNIQESAAKTWAVLTAKIRAQLQES